MAASPCSNMRRFKQVRSEAVIRPERLKRRNSKIEPRDQETRCRRASSQSAFVQRASVLGKTHWFQRHADTSGQTRLSA